MQGCAFDSGSIQVPAAAFIQLFQLIYKICGVHKTLYVGMPWK